MSKLNEKEAPSGFYAIRKKWRGYNICRDCDARSLCQENKDNWCIKNRCMAYDISDRNGEVIKGRDDGVSVIFKRIEKEDGSVTGQVMIKCPTEPVGLR